MRSGNSQHRKTDGILLSGAQFTPLCLKRAQVEFSDTKSELRRRKNVAKRIESEAAAAGTWIVKHLEDERERLFLVKIGEPAVKRRPAHDLSVVRLFCFWNRQDRGASYMLAL